MLSTFSFSFFFADPLKLCQVGWGVSLHNYFQVSLEMFYHVQVPALAGSLKDIQRLVPKPLLCCLGCVFRIVVPLECEPLPQSEVLSALEQVLIKDLYFAPFIFTSVLTSLPVPVAEKHPHSMMLPPPCFTKGWCQVSSRRDAWHSGQSVQS